MVLRPRSLRAPFREVMLKKKTPGMTQGRPSGFQCIDAYVYNCIYSIIYLSYIQVRIHTYIYIYMHVSYYLLMSVQKNHEPYPLEPHQQIPMAFPWKPISKSGTWKSDSSSSCSLNSPLYGLFYPFLGIPWYTCSDSSSCPSSELIQAAAEDFESQVSLQKLLCRIS